MALHTMRSLSRPALAYRALIWTHHPFNHRIHTSCITKSKLPAFFQVLPSKPGLRYFSQLQQPASQINQVPAISKPYKISFRTRVSSFAAGGAIVIVLVSGSLYFYYRSFFARVPITNRSRMLWYTKSYEEELGWAAEHWILAQQGARPRLEEDSVIVKLVKDITAKLQESELAKGLDLKIYVVDDFYEPTACSAPGRIFINTGELCFCESADEVAGVLAHEMGHLIGRHIPERRAAEAFARSIAQFFGWNAALGSDLISWRVQEREADHLGIFLMAQAGFDPNARVEYFERHHNKEKETLNGREPMPETMSTHPSHETRVKLFKEVLPEAKAIFEKSHKAAPTVSKTWESARTLLNEGKQVAMAQLDTAQQMHPEILLQKIDARLSRLEDTLERFTAAAVQMREKSNENVSETIVEAAALARKQMEAFNEPEVSGREGIFEHKIAEDGTVEEAVPKEAVQTAEGSLGLKEAAAQTTLTANASRVKTEEKEGAEKKETTPSQKGNSE